jgi:hypothetical protein
MDENNRNSKWSWLGDAGELIVYLVRGLFHVILHIFHAC